MQLFLKASDLEDHDTLQIKKLKRYVQIEESDILSIDDLLDIIEELYYECERLDEEYSDFKQQVEDNYRPIPQKEMYE